MIALITEVSKKLRTWVEGLDFIIHHPRSNSNHAGYIQRRKHDGLSDFRRAWWPQSSLERYSVLRHYAFLLDWALDEPGYRGQDAVLPPNARIIVFRLGHLGDVLHLLPTIGEIKRQRPDVRVELVTGPWNRDLIGANEDFSKIHYFTPDVFQFNRGSRNGVRALDEEKKFIRGIRADGVDVVFCPASPHFAELPIIIGLQPSHYVGGEWPLRDVPQRFPNHTRTFDSRHYEADSVADFLPDFGLLRNTVRLSYRPSEKSTTKVHRLIQQAGLEGKPFAVIFPGSGWPGKCWPPEHFAQLADHLVLEHGLSIVLAGSPAEISLCESVKASMQSPAVNLAGDCTIDESAALIEQSKLLIGNDSAPLHFAAAMNIPSVSLWGPTFPEKWAPRGSRNIAVKRSGLCHGCIYWHPAASCTGKKPCITTISVDDVKTAAGKLVT